ncbi:MAG: hypothetical protein Q9227_003722 [Pyrenula ochraceoflavens]
MVATLQNDLSAVTTRDASGNSKDLLFTVRPRGTQYVLSYFQSQDPNEARRRYYTPENITFGGEPIYVNPALPIVSAVAFFDFKKQTEEVRVYYVHSNSLQIRELKRSGCDGKWEPGEAFNNKEMELAQTSGITANVVSWDRQSKNGQLKVYFTNEKGFLSLMYNDLDEDEWIPRNNITG